MCQLFLQFDGPSTILVQSRGARINEIMSSREVNEVASSPRGVTVDPTGQKAQSSKEEEYNRAAEEAVNAGPGATRSVGDLTQEIKGTDQHIANVTKGGNVEIEKPGQKS